MAAFAVVSVASSTVQPAHAVLRRDDGCCLGRTLPQTKSSQLKQRQLPQFKICHCLRHSVSHRAAFDVQPTEFSFGCNGCSTSLPCGQVRHRCPCRELKLTRPTWLCQMHCCRGAAAHYQSVAAV
mmetsp:Transcript_67231/g.202885  ORF Transcript_67231/g.202885 Transcript_67231/m.202885 type:complete len:125 (+) Transcript_67231:139-513(+)